MFHLLTIPVATGTRILTIEEAVGEEHVDMTPKPSLTLKTCTGSDFSREWYHFRMACACFGLRSLMVSMPVSVAKPVQLWKPKWDKLRGRGRAGLQLPAAAVSSGQRNHGASGPLRLRVLLPSCFLLLLLLLHVVRTIIGRMRDFVLRV